MADNKIEIELIAKVDKISKQFDEFKKATEKQFEGLSGTISAGLEDGLGNTALSLAKKFGPIAVAIGVVKTAIDSAFKGEQIEAVNTQFEILAEQAHIASDVLRNELVGAAGGLIDDTELLKSANKALITLGESASSIPETLDLARKASAAFGGEITQNFELINQAVATGNTRSLKQIGIIIDQEKAYKDYAKTLGIATNELSKSGQQQAILNAVLEKGEKTFGAVNPELNKSKIAFDRLSVSVSNMLDSFNKLANSSLGSTIAATFNGLANLAQITSDKIRSLGGTEKLPINEQIEILTRGLEETNKQLTFAQTQVDRGFVNNNITPLTQQAKELQRQLDGLIETQIKLDARTFTPKTETPKDDVNQEVRAANRQKEINEINAFNTQVAQLTIENLSEQEIARNIANAKQIQEDQLFADQKKAFIQANNVDINNLTEQQAAYLEAQEAAHQARSNEIQRQGNLVGLAVAEGFKQLQVKAVVNGIQSITNSLLKGQNVFENFGKVILGLIGDFAIQIGTTIVATGIAYATLGDFTGTTPIIYGAALIALGTILKSLSGGGSSEASGGGGGTASSGAGGTFGPASQTAQLTAFNPGQVGTNVAVNISGNVLDRRETGLYIAEVIQEFANNSGQVIAGSTV